MQSLTAVHHILAPNAETKRGQIWVNLHLHCATSGRFGDAGQLELAKHIVVLDHRALTLYVATQVAIESKHLMRFIKL
jgi:hypothetical protein